MTIMKLIFCLTFLLTILPSVFTLRKKVCRLLALEGGGTKGAYHAGAFKAMVELMPSEEVAYDVIAGVSVGSINGLLFAGVERGNEKLVVSRLEDIWKNIKQEDIFVHWPYIGVIEGFFGKSFLDDSPMLPFLQRQIQSVGGQLKRRFSVGIMDAQAGKYTTINETVGGERMPHYVVGSASIPGFFPYIIEDKKVFIDGGTTDNMNLKGGIAKCKEIVGDDDAAIVIDILLCGPFNVPEPANLSKEKTYNVYSRGNELRDLGKQKWYLIDAMKAYPKINWRYMIYPRKPLRNYPYVPLNFDSKLINEALERGYEDATEIIKEGIPNLREVSKNLGLARRVKLH